VARDLRRRRDLTTAIQARLPPPSRRRRPDHRIALGARRPVRQPSPGDGGESASGPARGHHRPDRCGSGGAEAVLALGRRNCPEAVSGLASPSTHRSSDRESHLKRRGGMELAPSRLLEERRIRLGLICPPWGRISPSWRETTQRGNGYDN
jgi:hypothetical protein